MARNKKNNRYSYVQKQAEHTKFYNKNFNKTSSFRSVFSGSHFKNTSLVGAKFKYCNLNNVRFENCFLQGTHFKKCTHDGLKFERCILISTSFERMQLHGVEFVDCYILSTNTPACKQFQNSKVYNSFPDGAQYPSDLMSIVDVLRENPCIRKSGVLHRKGGKVNTIALDFLLDEFGVNYLINNLSKLNTLESDFYTLSYISAFLRRVGNPDSLDITRPTAT